MTLKLLAFFLSSIATASTVFAAAPELTRLFPAGGGAGQSVEVTLSGKFPDWPVDVACDSKSIRWEALPEKGKLRAVISDDAESSRCWVRIFHANGASAAKAFLIDGKPSKDAKSIEVVEAESNNGHLEAQALADLPCVVNGVLEKSKDVDTFAMELKMGRPLIASIEANRQLQSPVDTTLQILDRRGFVLAQNLDHFDLDPRLVFLPPKDDRYLVRVFGFPATPDSTIAFGGKENWVYRLGLRVDESDSAKGHREFSSESACVAIEDTAATGSQAISIPGCFDGILAKPKDRHGLTFSAKADTYWKLTILGREVGSAIDPVLSIEDAKGKELTKQDDVGEQRDPELDWKCPADGEYRLIVRDLHNSGSPDHFYRLTIRPTQPDIVLSVTSDLIQGTVDKEFEIPVTVQRTLGFDQEVKIQVVGLPSEITASEATSTSKGDTSKKVAIKVKAKRPFQGPIRVVAIHPSFGSTEHLATASDSIPIWLSIVSGGTK